MRGRKPNFQTLTKDTEGNLQAPVEVPRCPSVLKGEARREWWRMTRLLLDLKLIALLDRTTLAQHCAAWGRWVEAENKIAELGCVVKGQTGAAVVNPWLQVSQAAVRQMKELLAEFGLSPASRARLLGTQKPKERPRETGFEGVLANVG